MVQEPLVREPCVPAPLPPRQPPPGEPEYQVFGIEQTTALEICDGKRRLAVAASDFFNVQADYYQKQLEPRRWWQRRPKAPPLELTIDQILERTP